MIYSRRAATLFAASLGILFLAAPAAAQRRPECRQMETDTGGKTQAQTMCQGADGVWRPQQQPQQPQTQQAQQVPSAGSGALPPGFRGRVSYSGTHRGQVRTPGPPLRRLDVRSIINSATGGRTREYAGAYQLELSFDGNAVTGRYSGTGGIASGTVSGTRSGNRCHLVDERHGTVTEAECTATRFVGRAATPRGPGPQMTAELDANAVRIVDAAEEERERQLAAAEARARQQRYAAIRAQNDRIANGAGPIARRMDAIAEIDSRSWLAWTYEPGSMSNVRREGVRNARNYSAVGEFRYGDGRPGSLRAVVRNGAFQCLQFGNEPQCRPVGQPASHAIAAGILGALLSGGGGGGGNSGGRSDSDREFGQDMLRSEQQAADRAANQPPPPEPTPVAPIAPLYGVGPN